MYDKKKKKCLCEVAVVWQAKIKLCHSGTKTSFPIQILQSFVCYLCPHIPGSRAVMPPTQTVCVCTQARRERNTDRVLPLGFVGCVCPPHPSFFSYMRRYVYEICFLCLDRAPYRNWPRGPTCLSTALNSLPIKPFRCQCRDSSSFMWPQKKKKNCL